MAEPGRGEGKLSGVAEEAVCFWTSHGEILLESGYHQDAVTRLRLLMAGRLEESVSQLLELREPLHRGGVGPTVSKPYFLAEAYLWMEWPTATIRKTK